jgi:hypothetical protein
MVMESKKLMRGRCWHSHRQLKRKRKPIRGTVWMGKGAQHVVRRATTFKQGMGRRGKRPPGPPPDMHEAKDVENEAVSLEGAGVQPVVGHGGMPPPGPPPDFQGDMSQTSGIVAIAEPAPVVGHGGNPPPGPPPNFGGEKGVGNERVTVEAGEGQPPVGHGGKPPPGPPPA